MKVLLAGGGTAGHTSPLLATAAALQELRDDIEIVCLGTPRGLETTLIPEAGYRLELVPPVPLPRKPNADLARLPRRLASTLRQTGQVFDRIQPDVVVGFGGYVSVPAYVVARKRKLPLIVHEGNALPGIANKLGARCTTHVVTSFPDTDLKHAQYLGLPIRRAITSIDRDAMRAEAREFFGLNPDHRTLLVTGGSQGARSINHAVSAAAAELAKADIQVLHAAGRIDEVQPVRPDGAPPYVAVEFIDRMDLAYAAADLIVCRAGANTVLETAAVGLPAVFVPLPHGNGEQARNADALVSAKAALVVDDAAFTSRWIADVLTGLLNDGARLDAMSTAAQGVVPADADVRLAELIVQVAR